ncbi:MAG: RES family NAD+ phosphorylase [Chloroflexota bacterium]
MWVRSHRTGYSPLYFGRSGQNRFDAPGAVFGVLYVAADAHGAFIETFGRQLGRLIVSMAELADRELSEVRPARPLRLVDMSGAGLARIGADARVMSGRYDISQPWSLALHNHPDQPDGLLYRSRHDPSRLCTALFDRVAPVLSTESLGSFADPRNAALLGDVLDRYGYGLIA